VLGQGDDAGELMAERLGLLAQVVVVGDVVLLVEDDAVEVVLALLELVAQGGDVGVVLELVEGALQHELGVDALDAEQVENHVVGEVEGGVEGVGLAFDDVFGGGWRHALVDHEDDDAFVVEAAAAGATGHLDVLAGGDPADVFAVPFATGGEEDGARGHVEAHGEGLGGEEDFEKALQVENLVIIISCKKGVK